MTVRLNNVELSFRGNITIELGGESGKPTNLFESLVNLGNQFMNSESGKSLFDQPTVNDKATAESNVSASNDGK